VYPSYPLKITPMNNCVAKRLTATSRTGPVTDEGVCVCHWSSGSAAPGDGLYFHSPTRPYVVPPANRPAHSQHPLTQKLCGLARGRYPKAERPRFKPSYLRILHTYIHPFNSPLSRTTWVSLYQKGKTNLDFTEARNSEWQWHQLGHMQVCISLQTDNHASTPPLGFL